MTDRLVKVAPNCCIVLLLDTMENGGITSGPQTGIIILEEGKDHFMRINCNGSKCKPIFYNFSIIHRLSIREKLTNIIYINIFGGLKTAKLSELTVLTTVCCPALSLYEELLLYHLFLFALELSNLHFF